MSTAVRALLLAALLTLVPVGIGVGVSGSQPPEPARPAYTATDLADFDTATAVVRRAPFCERVPVEAVNQGLGVDGDLTATWSNGEKSAAVPGGDVAHEYGCAFGAGGADDAGGAGGAGGGAGGVPEARAWVFVPPVTPERATELVTAKPASGCTALPDSPAYGTPSITQLCRSDAGLTLSHRGLFGDAWLSCTLTLPAAVPQDELVARAGRWCVAVAQAASADS